MNILTKAMLIMLVAFFMAPAFAGNSKHEDNHWKSEHRKESRYGDHDYKEKFSRESYSRSYNTKNREITDYEKYFLSTQDILVASDGDVTLTFISKEAAHSSDLFLSNSSGAILNNQNTVFGQMFNLGNFAAGTKLVFNIFNNTTGNQFFTGLPESNPDNTLHAIFKLINENTIQVGFEDLFGGGDKDYNDLIFNISNVKLGLSSIPAVPEPQTYLLFLVGLLLVSRLSKQRR